MATEDEIQAAVNAVTTGLALLGDVNWSAYCTDGPGMHAAVLVAQSLAAQAGMIQTVMCVVLDPLGVLAFTLDEAMKG